MFVTQKRWKFLYKLDSNYIDGSNFKGLLEEMFLMHEEICKDHYSGNCIKISWS